MDAEPTVLTVTYVDEPERVLEFGADGTSFRFGRDDSGCEIPIWSAINGTRLSRTAGVLWRMGDEVWLRNLSTRHDLEITEPGHPPEALLPPRRDDGFDRGPARSVPGETAWVRGPDGCVLLVRQRRAVLAPPELSAAGGQTTSLPPLPREHAAVAAALCEPLIWGGQLPATYSQVMRRAGTGTLKRTRTVVGTLCRFYAEHAPALRARVGERMARELRQLGIASDPRLRAGVWTFELSDSESMLESERRRALALPDYFEIAHLLVRRGIVTAEDLHRLPSDGQLR